MKTVEEKLDDLIDAEIDYLTSLCLYNDYDELRQIILNNFGYKDLTENQIKEEYQSRFDYEEIKWIMIIPTINRRMNKFPPTP